MIKYILSSVICRSSPDMFYGGAEIPKFFRRMKVLFLVVRHHALCPIYNVNILA